MQIEEYLVYSGDKVLSIESMSGDEGEVIHKVNTKFGNTLYWEGTTGKVVLAEWVVPRVNIIDRLDEKDLQKISGRYYLESYGEKFNE